MSSLCMKWGKEWHFQDSHELGPRSIAPQQNWFLECALRQVGVCLEIRRVWYGMCSYCLLFYSEISKRRDPDTEDSAKKRRANYTRYNKELEGTQVRGLTCLFCYLHIYSEPGLKHIRRLIIHNIWIDLFWKFGFQSRSLMVSCGILRNGTWDVYLVPLSETQLDVICSTKPRSN